MPGHDAVRYENPCRAPLSATVAPRPPTAVIESPHRCPAGTRVRRHCAIAATALALLAVVSGCSSGGSGHFRRPHGRVGASSRHPFAHRHARAGSAGHRVLMPASSLSCHPGVNAAEFWMVNHRQLLALRAIAPATVRRAIKSRTLFVLGAPHRPNRLGQSVAVFKSYAVFSQEVATISRTTHWVLYDNEHWPPTPAAEQRDPVRYETLFAGLAHRYGYRVILTPGQDLARVNVRAGSRLAAGNAVWRRYIAMRLPAVSAKVADIYEIQSQAYERTPYRPANTYVRVLRAAIAQARAANPHATIFAGISTDRVSSAREMFHDFMATRGLVAGYWLNIPRYHRLAQPALAGQFLRRLPIVTGAAGRTCAKG